jgi:hypothetical protein
VSSLLHAHKVADDPPRTGKRSEGLRKALVKPW